MGLLNQYASMRTSLFSIAPAVHHRCCAGPAARLRVQGRDVLHELAGPGLLHAAGAARRAVRNRPRGAGGEACTRRLPPRARRADADLGADCRGRSWTRRPLRRPLARPTRPSPAMTRPLAKALPPARARARSRSSCSGCSPRCSCRMRCERAGASAARRRLPPTPAPGPREQFAVSTQRLTSNGFEWQSNDARIQHDVQVRRHTDQRPLAELTWRRGNAPAAGALAAPARRSSTACCSTRWSAACAASPARS